MKICRITLLSILSSLCIISCSENNVDYKSNDIAIIYTNDIHCEIKNGMLSFASLKSYKNELEKQYKYVSLVDSGDAIEGSVYGTMSKGEIVTKAMNLVGFDVCAIGNHEFNYGTDRLKELISMSNATYINSNIIYSGTKDNWIENLPKYKIISYGDVKIGYLGITTPNALTTAAPSLFMEDNKVVYNFNNGSFANFYNGIQSIIDEIKSQGVDYVIALAHMGDSEVSGTAPYDSSTLVKETVGIDVVLDGHSHTERLSKYETNKDGKRILITQTGTKLNAVGTLLISKDGNIHNCLVTGKFDEDENTKDGIDELCSIYEETLNQVVATTNLSLPITDSSKLRLARVKETQLGDFASDAMMLAVSKSADVDLCFVNGGGLRAELPSGQVTFRQVIDINPFNNDVVISELKGQQILDMFEFFTKDYMKNENPSLMQISGAKIKIDISKSLNAEIDDDKNLINILSSNEDRRIQSFEIYDKTSKTFKAIDPSKIYKVSSYDYILANGGEGMLHFLADNRPVLREICRDYQTLIDYLVELNGDLSLYSEPQNRIEVLD